MFFVNTDEGELIKNFANSKVNENTPLVVRATLEGSQTSFKDTTKIELAFSSILDLHHDSIYQAGQLITQLERD